MDVKFIPVLQEVQEVRELDFPSALPQNFSPAPPIN
jgi:hypothetical protein